MFEGSIRAREIGPRANVAAASGIPQTEHQENRRGKAKESDSHQIAVSDITQTMEQLNAYGSQSPQEAEHISTQRQNQGSTTGVGEPSLPQVSGTTIPA